MINPYCQILENSSRNFSKILNFRVMTQTVYLENSSNFFRIFNFGVVSQTVLLENLSIRIFVSKNGLDEFSSNTVLLISQNFPIWVKHIELL